MLKDVHPQTRSSPEEWMLYAQELKKNHRIQEALAAASEALKLDPSLYVIWDLIGMVFLEMGRWGEAKNYLYEAKKLAPDDVVIRSHYAIALMEEGLLDDAYEEIKSTLRTHPRSPDALYVRGEIFCRTGHYDLAVGSYRAAREAGGLHHAAAFGEAFARFIGGDFENGMALMASAELAIAPIELPDWQGKPDPQLHLLVCGEYGFGDIIQFSRYIAPLEKVVGKITLSIPYPLMSLMRQSFPHLPLHVYHVPPLERGHLPPLVSDAVPDDADARCFYDRLPHLLAPPFRSAAEIVPYLRPDEKAQKIWSEKLAAIPRPRIGLVWSGNPLNQNNHNRSIPFEELEPLIRVARPHLVSLEKNGHSLAARAGIYDAAISINNFADFAAAVAETDLIISVCSAPAHLAGAMGKAVWTLLAFNADWRWLIGREDSIWYPTMRLFRQNQPKAWYDVIINICGEIKRLISGEREVLKPVAFQGGLLKRHPKAIVLPSYENDLFNSKSEG